MISRFSTVGASNEHRSTRDEKNKKQTISHNPLWVQGSIFVFRSTGNKNKWHKQLQSHYLWKSSIRTCQLSVRRYRTERGKNCKIWMPQQVFLFSMSAAATRCEVSAHFFKPSVLLNLTSPGEADKSCVTVSSTSNVRQCASGSAGRLWDSLVKQTADSALIPEIDLPLTDTSDTSNEC